MEGLEPVLAAISDDMAVYSIVEEVIHYINVSNDMLSWYVLDLLEESDDDGLENLSLFRI